VTFGVLAATSSSVSDVEPGVLAFLIVAGIGVVLVFLLRSMNKQFRKIAPNPSADAAFAPGPHSDSDPGSGSGVGEDAVTGPGTPS
jgi:hypothetical protein